MTPEQKKNQHFLGITKPVETVNSNGSDKKYRRITTGNKKNGHKRKSITGRRRTKRERKRDQAATSLSHDFSCDATLQTEVGSTATVTHIEVRCMPGVEVETDDDGTEVDGGGDTDTDDFNSDNIWEEEDILEFFLETRRARNLGIAFYYR